MMGCDSGGSRSAPASPMVADADLAVVMLPVDTPLLSGTPFFTAEGGVELRFTLQEDTSLSGRFYDPVEPSNGVVSIQSLPAHGLLTLQPDEQAFNYQVEPDYWGEDSFTYATFDGQQIQVQLTIAAENDAPVLSPNLPRVATQGNLFFAELLADDVDGDELRFSATQLPAWLAIDASSGELSGIPRQSDVGIVTGIGLRVTDSAGLFDELNNVALEVVDVNDAPTLNLTRFPSTILGRESIDVNVYPDDPDGDDVVLDVETNAFLSTLVTGGSINLTASDVNDVTTVNLVIKATDQLGRISREVLPLTIYPRTASGRGITLSGSEEGRGVHLVILGDGYQQDQQDLFKLHVEDVLENFNLDAGIARHLGAFNIHMISTVSEDSGADDNEMTDSRDTAFDSVYNCRSIPRLICANTLSMFEASLLEYPAVDQLILLVNDGRYGGSGNSGGSVAITSAYSPEIALHEMGHSLADLADEYVDNLIVETSSLPPFEEGRYPNVTGFSDPAEVPWSHWITESESVSSSQTEVGVFEGGLYRSTGVYRPTFDSRMRSFDAPFGSVNSEQWILRLYTLTEGIRGFSPINQNLDLLAGESQTFVVSPLFDASIQSVEWMLNGVAIDPGSDPNKLILSPQVGNHVLSMTVTDVSGAIRLEPPHAGIFNWKWNLNVQ